MRNMVPARSWIEECGLLDCSMRLSEAARCHVDLSVCTRRYDKILSDLLQLLDLSKPPLPDAALAYAVMKCSGIGLLPAQLPGFEAPLGSWEETIDLLTSAASVGSASATQALIDCGPCRAHSAWRS